MKAQLAALVLAAGQGKRMRSRLPKVLHPCAGEPLVVHAVRLALARRARPVVVVIDPHGTRIRETLVAAFPKAPLLFAVQREPLGTGDAVRAGLAALPTWRGRVLILYGDVALLRPETVAPLERALKKHSLAMLTARLPRPTGYGRVIRDGDRALRVVEEKDAAAAERRIDEVNVGVYLCGAALLRRAVGRLDRKNAQHEIYLTDVVAIAAGLSGAVPVLVDDASEVLGVNTRAELAAAEKILRARLVQAHQARGVTFHAPEHTWLDRTVVLGADVVIGVGVQLYGNTRVGAGAQIEGPSVLRDAVIGPGARVHAFSHAEGAVLERGAVAGPFARLRPGAHLEEGARVGNFVELKKARLGRGAKANHLAYLGDAEIGAASNIGAGTITCNYDGGPIKNRTRIEAGAFIGSNSTLVAPVSVGEGAYVAAGSTITRDVPQDALAFGRARQENRDGYATRLRRRLGATPKTRGGH
ncbi:MAG: bifunctional UDP-N-acetylglucosamine diphosphorylase/glucosamine-1-phosphate N-acetyltransferase GlmU [Deltaproteobacteria bacterium]|nr:bifunctional UDP-N-acetylglucosamine diphosphorylase/glucosamine-1-phosphate N-acetyltransferase GlmU [Deltaproteobacteria bacterium]